MRFLRTLGVTLGLTACGASSNTNGSSSTGGNTAAGGNDATGGDYAEAGSLATDATQPSPFGAATQLWIGAPDDAATTVVYAFSKSVSCSSISTHGWDAKVPSGTQLVEMKEFGHSPQPYSVVTTKTPAPGEASVNYTFSAAANATETSASGGSVTLTALTPKLRVTGSYALDFGGTQLNGTIDATYCAGGVEP